jgi:DNA end-binding protein Ku
VPANRPIASLTISFGLVAIPVKLYSAVVSSERLSFHLLRKSDGSRLKEQFVAVNDGKIVERDQMAKGYEFAKGKHVMFSSEELKVLDASTSPLLEIAQFVPLESVDPMYFLATYYMLPDKGGAKPYALLATALNQEGRCGVGKWISRGREHAIIVRPLKNGLVMHQLHFKAEIRDLKDLGFESTKVSEPEVKLARQLISHLSANKFDPSEFVDEHRARVQAEIKKKINGKEISMEETATEAPRSNVINLMDALKASLKAKGTRAPKKSSRPSARKTRKTA